MREWEEANALMRLFLLPATYGILLRDVMLRGAVDSPPLLMALWLIGFALFVCCFALLSMPSPPQWHDVLYVLDQHLVRGKGSLFDDLLSQRRSCMVK